VGADAGVLPFAGADVPPSAGAVGAEVPPFCNAPQPASTGSIAINSAASTAVCVRLCSMISPKKQDIRLCNRLHNYFNTKKLNIQHNNA
jgi:hypothetical protein